MSPIAKKLGQRIRSLRKKSELTQDGLAELAGLSGKHIGEIERGEVNLTVQALEQIATALEVATFDLLQCDHEAEVEELRAELMTFIGRCSEDEVKLAHRLMAVLR